MLGRIVKYFQTRKEVYKDIESLLQDIADKDPELRRAAKASFNEDGLTVYIGNDQKLFKKICGQITIIYDELDEKLANSFESAIFEKREDGSLEKTMLGHKLIRSLDFLREEMRPTHISILNNLAEMGNEFELIDVADRLELYIHLGKGHSITTSVDGVDIIFNYNGNTTDGEIAHSLMKIFLGKTRG